LESSIRGKNGFPQTGLEKPETIQEVINEVPELSRFSGKEM